MYHSLETSASLMYHDGSSEEFTWKGVAMAECCTSAYICGIRLNNEDEKTKAGRG